MKLSATIICRNEENHILECLASLTGVDEIVVCDTGSSDQTVGLVRDLNDPRVTLTFFPWEDHFARARNAALASATGDWCIVIDADEVLAPGTVSALRKAIKSNPQAKTFHFECRAKSNPNYRHSMVRAHRRTPDVYWRGRVHEALSWDDRVKAEGAVLVYGYSTAHNQDPDRVLRLLQMDYDESRKTGNTPEYRTLYYLGREWFYRREWAKAIEIFTERVALVGFRSENADAWLYLARCYWAISQGDAARDAVLKSLLMVPDCREAMEFMAEISYEEQAIVWKRHASCARNTGVLFVRSLVA
jgi:glycosyltransferase involved in cell wall biosynthesis